jgi:CHAT domain-containing protein/tetratricopeptide (TPR) repeat protein
MKSRTSFSASIVTPKKWGNLFLVVTLLAFCSCTAQTTAARSSSHQLPEERQAFNYLQEAIAKTVEAVRAGEPLTRQITGGESQSFSISLATGQYAEISVEQHGSILSAALFDPQGVEVIQMEYPGGGYGPIYLSHVAVLSGNYRLEIRSTNKWANAANYDVALVALRSAEVTDQSLVEAQQAFARGQKSSRDGQDAAAIKSYERALAYWQASHNYHWQAVTQYALSQAYRSLGNRQKTEECLTETLKILAQQMAPNAWRLKASALNDLGPIYAAVGEKEKALSVLNEALTLYAANQDGRGQASSLNNLATTHGRAGDFVLARELVERALTFRKAENDKPGVINLLNSLGAISDRLGEPDQALNYFTQSLRGWEELDEVSPADRLRVAVLLNNLAFASDKLGKWDQALDYYDKALAKYNNDDPNKIATLDNKGELYAALGNPAKAKECYDEALNLLASTGKPDLDVKAGLLVHVGQLALAEGDYLTAIRNFDEARDTQPSKPKLADVLTNLGAAYALQGDLKKALEAYHSALEIQLKLNDRRGQALTLQKRGEAYLVLGQQAEALDKINRALVLWQSVKDIPGEAATLNSLARIQRAQGNLRNAMASSDQAVAIVESQRTRISSRQLRTSYFAAREDYYELNVDLKMQLSKSGNADAYMAAALESSEMARARVLLDALSEAGVDRAEIDRGSDSRVARLIEQRVALLSRLRAKALARTRLLSGVHTITQVATIDKNIDEIAGKYDEVETQIRALSPRFAALIRPQPATLREIQQQLDGDTLLLEYSLGEKRCYVWAVTKDSIRGFELPRRDEIESTALRLTRSLTERNREVKNEDAEQWRQRLAQADAEYADTSAALSKMVIEPVGDLLGGKRLVIVADGALQLVSFGALSRSKQPGAETVTAKTKQLSNNSSTSSPRTLIEDHEIVYLPSASVLAIQRRELENRKSAPYAVAVLADPVFDQEGVKREIKIRGTDRAAARQPQSQTDKSQRSVTNTNTRTDLTRALDDIGLSRFSWLPFSRKEADSILSVVPKGESRAALGFEASRTTAMSKELSKYRIVHFATHGVVDFQHPELSGIVLSMVDEKGQPQDGYLRLHDIYNLNLPADLVVLSACQTGIGKQIKGEGLIALTRGFMYAGAQRVVASLWKVDDTATSELMAEFYKQMFTNHEKPAAALRAAQLKLSKVKRWRSSYFWAGFILQGEWN